jgi:transposase InsO family protein
VVPFFEDHGIPLSRILTDRGTEYCGVPDRHPYELYLGIEDIEHSRTKTKSPQTNGICERFNKTVLKEFYRVAFRKRRYASLEALQTDFDHFLAEYNAEARISPIGATSHLFCLFSESNAVGSPEFVGDSTNIRSKFSGISMRGRLRAFS